MAFDIMTAQYCAQLCSRVYDGDTDGFVSVADGDAKIKTIGDQLCTIVRPKASIVELWNLGWPEAQAVCIRGTATIGAWLQDARIAMTADPMGGIKGLAHIGFLQSTALIYPWVETHLDKAKPVIITGHSLGAAIATLLSQLLAERGYTVLPVYTFGCPRIGDSEFAEGYTLEHWRVVNNFDPVPHIPEMGVHTLHTWPLQTIAHLNLRGAAIQVMELSKFYHHVGTEWRLPNGGPPGWLGGRLYSLFTHIKAGPASFAIKAISDHFMDSYMKGLLEYWKKTREVS
jgi:hypothetical protein